MPNLFLLRIFTPNRRPDIDTPLSEWNDLMDKAFKNPTEVFDYRLFDDESLPKQCCLAFDALRSCMVSSLFTHDDRATFVGDLFERKTSFRESIKPLPSQGTEITQFDLELVCCAKNLMRWYIQVCLPKLNRKFIVDPIKAWKDVKSLNRCLDMIEVPELSRDASQLFFFSTFPALPHDQALINTMNELTSRHNFAERLLTVLARTHVSDERLLLSLIRNVHNAVSGFPEQCLRSFEHASVIVESYWGGHGDSVSFSLILREVGIAALQFCDSSLSEFQAVEVSLSELQAELVVEILRCCFALRFGAKLLDDRWRLFIDLCLHSTNNLCQNSAVSILVDAPTKYDVDAALMLDIISRQLDHIKSSLIEDSDAAAIIPILMVLHKFCVANPRFRLSMHRGIFVDEPSYQAALKLQMEKTGTDRPKNAKPLDTPKGSLRFNLVLLMTCPHGIVKRLAGELLWSIVDGQTDEFIRRVGLGNALPFLSAKGLAKLPV
jgi:Guanine nucleotide exchange factor synembryn